MIVFCFFNTHLETKKKKEPHRSVSCAGGPLTSLHLIVPSITLAYSITDILNGLRLGGAFLAHGIATFSVMMIFLQQGLPQFVNSMLVMEVSLLIFISVFHTFSISFAFLRSIQNFFSPFLNFFEFRCVAFYHLVDSSQS